MKIKNEEIVRMLGWKIIKKDNYFIYEKSNGVQYATFKELLFHSDANWQFEAIDFIENKLGFDFCIDRSFVSIRVTSESIGFFETSVGHSNRGGKLSKKEAVFEAIHQVSSYINQKNDNN